MANIPKKVHYCWFGGNPYPDLIKKCMESWKKVLPEYEFIEWNENNFDVNQNQYIKEAYENKKWAFVTDYARLKVLYDYGGIYLDSDVEVLKPIDAFLKLEGFSGFEAKDTVPTAIMGAKKGHPFIKKLLDDYDNRKFVLEDGSFDMTANTIPITNKALELGLIQNGKKQTIDNFVFYPPIYFCPNNIGRIVDKPSRKSYTIHHSAGSWSENGMSERNLYWKTRRYIGGRIRRIFGTDNVKKIKRKLGLYGNEE